MQHDTQVELISELSEHISFFDAPILFWFAMSITSSYDYEAIKKDLTSEVPRVFFIYLFDSFFIHKQTRRSTKSALGLSELLPAKI